MALRMTPELEAENYHACLPMILHTSTHKHPSIRPERKLVHGSHQKTKQTEQKCNLKNARSSSEARHLSDGPMIL
eukprot:3271800-Amphidinium_carterae.1